ncbi:MAG: hypothetical protein ABSE50_18415 [Xanthobacteraceae bacterium]
MSTTDNFLNSGTQNFATAGNWSAGVPNINDDAKIELAAKTTVNMNAEEGANSISIGSNDDLEINGVIFDVASGMSAINGTINVNNGGTLALKGAGVANSGDINLNSTGSTTKIEVVPGLNDTESDTTITGGGAGTLSTIALGGLSGTGDFSGDYIGGDGTDDVTLTLADETIQGAGAIGSTHFTLDVGAGSVIDADISTLSVIGASLILNTDSRQYRYDLGLRSGQSRAECTGYGTGRHRHWRRLLFRPQRGRLSIGERQFYRRGCSAVHGAGRNSGRRHWDAGL